MEKITCQKCGRKIAKNGLKVHETFCKGNDGEPEMKEESVEQTKEVETKDPEPVKAIKKATKIEQEEPEDDEEQEEDEEEEESNPLLMICITVIAVALILGFFIFGRRPQ